MLTLSIFVGCESTPTTDATQPPASAQPATINDTSTPAPAPDIAVPPTDDITVSPTQIDIDAREYRRMFDAALLVLRDAGFVLDRRDYRFGIITTRPLFAPTIFEPWHARHTSSSTTLESTFNDQRRLVRVSLLPAQPTLPDDATQPLNTDTYQLIVEVQLERRQHGLQRLEGSADAGHVISSMRRTDRANNQSDHWRAMGRDTALEERLLQQIVRRSLQPVAVRE